MINAPTDEEREWMARVQGVISGLACYMLALTQALSPLDYVHATAFDMEGLPWKAEDEAWGWERAHMIHVARRGWRLISMPRCLSWEDSIETFTAFANGADDPRQEYMAGPAPVVSIQLGPWYQVPDTAYNLGYMRDEEAVDLAEALILDGAVIVAVELSELTERLYVRTAPGYHLTGRVAKPNEVEVEE